MNRRFQTINTLLALIFLLGRAYPLSAQGTVFTYQGRLQDGTNHATGLYDLVFTVCTNATGPSQVSSAVTNLATTVSSGLFTAALDFGSGVFDGSPRWLEIGVRTNGGGPFTTLSPRQALTATPYAMHAGSVNAAGISGNIPASNIGDGTITANMLAPGAAATNLAANGQGTVPSGGMVLSSSDNDTNLVAAGYVRSGGYVEAPNLWRERVAGSPPVARGGHTAVWTGSKMIVWGGNCSNSRFNDGGVYDPVANTWSPMATNGAPAGRGEFVPSVWTGTEMIVWGGYYYDGSYHYFNDGGRYNLASNNWTAMTTDGAPTARYRHTTIWTGTEMIVWGGMASDSGGVPQFAFADGGRYNPISNTWSAVSTSSAPTPRLFHTAVWTGTEMIVWGGMDASGQNLRSDGGRYNPTTDTWVPINSTNEMAGRYRHTAVWTGSEMIVWGGQYSSGSYWNTGGRYNPATGIWSPTDYSFAPTGRRGHTAVWTGREMIIWGGGDEHLNDGGSYEPLSNTWTPVTNAPRAPAGRTEHTAVWTGSEMIVFGGFCFSDTWSCKPPKLLYLYLKP